MITCYNYFYTLRYKRMCSIILDEKISFELSIFSVGMISSVKLVVLDFLNMPYIVQFCEVKLCIKHIIMRVPTLPWHWSQLSRPDTELPVIHNRPGPDWQDRLTITHLHFLINTSPDVNGRFSSILNVPCYPSSCLHAAKIKIMDMKISFFNSKYIVVYPIIN